MTGLTSRTLRRRRRPLVLVVLACVWALTAPSGAAAPTWTPAATISTPTPDDLITHTAVTADGHASMVLTSLVGGDFTTWTSRRAPGGSWTSGSQRPLGTTAQSAAIAADRTTATAVWGASDGGDLFVASARRSLGAAWTPSVKIAEGLPGYPAHVAVAANRRGNVVAAWIMSGASGSQLQVVRRLSNGTWTAPVDVADVDHRPFDDFDLSISESGAIVVVWETDADSIATAHRPAGGPWDSRDVISTPGRNAGRPHVALDAEGNAVAVWVETDGAHLRATAAHHPADGIWQQRTAVSVAGAHATDPHVTVDGAGRFTVAWSQISGAFIGIQASTRAANGVWSPAGNVSGTGTQSALSGLVADRAGNVTAAWVEDQARVVASRRAPGGQWSPGVEVSDHTESVNGFEVAQPVVDARGNVTLSWNGESSEEFIHVASLDVVGPTSRITAPSAAFTLGPIGVKWMATDEISGISSYRTRVSSAPEIGPFTNPRTWQASTTSKAATYAPTAPGRTYCFTARATDAAGHVGAYSAQRCTAVPLDDRALAASADWRRTTPASAYRDTATTAAARGATLTSDRVSTKHIALVATRRPGAGSVDVFLGTTKLRRVSLASTTVRPRQVIDVATFRSRRDGKVRIVTVNDRPVTIDGLGVSAR